MHAVYVHSRDNEPVPRRLRVNFSILTIMTPLKPLKKTLLYFCHYRCPNCNLFSSDFFSKIFFQFFSSVSNEPETVKMSRTRDSERMDVPVSSRLDHGPTLLCHWCINRTSTRESLLDLSEGWVWLVFSLFRIAKIWLLNRHFQNQIWAIVK